MQEETQPFLLANRLGTSSSICFRLLEKWRNMAEHGTDFWLIPHWWSSHATISAQRQRCRGNVSEATGPTQKASPGIGIWVDLRWAGGSYGARKKLGDPSLFEWEMEDIQLIAVKLGYPYPISNRNGRLYILICLLDIGWPKSHMSFWYWLDVSGRDGTWVILAGQNSCNWEIIGNGICQKWERCRERWGVWSANRVMTKKGDPHTILLQKFMMLDHNQDPRQLWDPCATTLKLR